MRPIVHGPDTPRSIDAFGVRWESAVSAHRPVSIDDHGYLREIARYSNIEPKELGVFAVSFTLAPDAELDRLLGLVHALPYLPSELAARLLGRSALRHRLRAFHASQPALETGLREAAFTWIDPFLVEGTLARTLYGYGMYRHFHDDHSADEAASHARALLESTVGASTDTVVALGSRLPWGAWFDRHSCTDQSYLLVDRQTRRGLLLALSHSD
jgi:hypothetical protein